MKIGGIDFKEIDLTKVDDYAKRYDNIDNPDGNPIIDKLNRKIYLMKAIKRDIKFYNEMNSISEEPDKKFVKKLNSKFKKVEKESIELLKQLGWIK